MYIQMNFHQCEYAYELQGGIYSYQWVQQNTGNRKIEQNMEIWNKQRNAYMSKPQNQT